MSRAAIVVVGSEILKGLIQDTNSNWLAGRLTELGFDVRRVIVVPDSVEDIEWALLTALETAEVVVVTGGLGFTEDDITALATAKALGLDLVFSQEAAEMIRRRVHGEPTYQLKAAYVPRGSRPMFNPVGVSPGIHLQVGEKHVFLLPGVPAEMKAVFEHEVARILIALSPRVYVKMISVVTEHEKETAVEQAIKPLRERYRSVYFKTHASTPVRLSVLVASRTQEGLEELISSVLEEIKRTLKLRSVEVRELRENSRW